MKALSLEEIKAKMLGFYQLLCRTQSSDFTKQELQNYLIESGLPANQINKMYYTDGPIIPILGRHANNINWHWFHEDILDKNVRILHRNMYPSLYKEASIKPEELGDKALIDLLIARISKDPELLESFCRNLRARGFLIQTADEARYPVMVPYNKEMTITYIQPLPARKKPSYINKKK